MTYTLIADGASDRVLVPVPNWALKQRGVTRVVPQWADFTRIHRPRGIEARLTSQGLR